MKLYNEHQLSLGKIRRDTATRWFGSSLHLYPAPIINLLVRITIWISNRVIYGFIMAMHSSLSFGSQHVCSRYSLHTIGLVILEAAPRRDRPSAHMKRASTLITLVHEQLVNHFLMSYIVVRGKVVHFCQNGILGTF